MSSETIKSATAADEAAVLGVITLAFSTDPLARWIYPNPREYLAHFPSLVLAIGAKAFASGSAHYAEGFAGATLWLPPGVSPDEELRVAMIRETVAERLQGDLFMILEQAGAGHPEEPHWYLWAIGTDPAVRAAVTGRRFCGMLWHHVIATQSSPIWNLRTRKILACTWARV